MQYELLHAGTNAIVHVALKQGEKIKAESGAMVAKSKTLHISGSMWGGMGGAFKRSFLGGETFFFQDIAAATGDGEVLIAPSVPGDITILPITDGKDYFIQNGCLLAAFDDITMDTKAQKLTAGLFSGAGFFVLHVSGFGHVVISAFGAIMEVPVPAGDEYIIDNGHVVAWSGDMEYHVVKAGKSWMSSMTSGEGLACKFHGPGKVWIQTRNPQAFGAWVRRFVPSRGGLFSLFG